MPPSSIGYKAMRIANVPGENQMGLTTIAEP